jgi:hypothetical protein
MREFGFAPWVEVRARRLRVYRAIVNSIWVLVSLIVVIDLARGTTSPPAWLLTLVIGIYLLCWFALACGFFYGFIRCPSCDSRFAPKFPPLWAPRRCQNCSFDIKTLKHV